MKKARALSLIMALVFSLSACSPHPGSGAWVPVGENSSGFSRLVVHFEGRAELFKPGVEGDALRCFWGGESGNSIFLDCSLAENAEVKVRYGLEVDEDGRAALTHMGRQVATLVRQDVKNFE
jgi:hypothetical protein